ncbi:hypothetical protein C8Q77DRAFT_108369 [Trametes polyzona]|nr:hypothetical protein C8Q77DRAFT_108369 [Trametes polyzona]
MAGASNMLETAGDGEEDETMVKATSLCGDNTVKDCIECAMIAMGQDPAIVVGKRAPPIPPASVTDKGKGKGKKKGKGRDPTIDIERTYARECECLTFPYVALSRPASKGTRLQLCA